MLTETLQQTLSISDLEEGKVDSEAVSKALDSLMESLGRIRAEMHEVLLELSSLSEDKSSSKVAISLGERLVQLQQEMSQFKDSYAKIRPVIRYFKIKQGINPDSGTTITSHPVVSST